jgi:hypothetical protein
LRVGLVVARAHAEQSLLQLAVRGQRLRGHLLCDAPVDHHADAIGHVDRDTEVLLDQQHADRTVARQLAQRLHDLLDDGRRQPLGRLVHHQQARLEQQCAADRQHLLLAAREHRAAVVLAFGQAREHRVDALHLAALARHQAQRLVDRQRRPHATPLRHVRDAAPRDLVRRQAEDLFAGQLDAAAGTHEPGDRVAQRGLAHAVAADDAEHAAFDREAHTLQRVGMSVVDVQSFDDQHRPARGRRVGAITRPQGHQCRPPM